MSETYFSQSVIAHESAFIYIAIDTIEPSFTSILPHLKVAPVFEDRFTLSVLSYHELITIEFS